MKVKAFIWQALDITKVATVLACIGLGAYLFMSLFSGNYEAVWETLKHLSWILAINIVANYLQGILLRNRVR